MGVVGLDPFGNFFGFLFFVAMVACGCHLCWEKSEQSCSLLRETKDYSCYFVHHLDWGDKEYVDKVDVDQPVFVSLHCQDGGGLWICGL